MGLRDSSADELADIALALRTRVELPESTRYRLVGVGLAGFRDPEEALPQGELFAETGPARDRMPAGRP